MKPRDPIRIAVDGVQCTGKTTLFNALQVRYATRFTFIPEAARVVAPLCHIFTEADWQRVHADPDRLAAFYAIEEQWQMTAEDDAGDFIADGSLFVTAAYRQYFGLDPHIHLAVSRCYSILLCCCPSVTFATDGFRFSRGRDDIDILFNNILEQHYTGSVIYLPSGPERPDAAIRAVDSFIANYTVREPR